MWILKVAVWPPKTWPMQPELPVLINAIIIANGMPAMPSLPMVRATRTSKPLGSGLASLLGGASWLLPATATESESRCTGTATVCHWCRHCQSRQLAAGPGCQLGDFSRIPAEFPAFNLK